MHIVCFGHDYSDQGYMDEATADLVVAAVNAQPALLAERRRLRDEAWDEGYQAGKTNAEELALMAPPKPLLERVGPTDPWPEAVSNGLALACADCGENPWRVLAEQEATDERR